MNSVKKDNRAKDDSLSSMTVSEGKRCVDTLACTRPNLVDRFGMGTMAVFNIACNNVPFF